MRTLGTTLALLALLVPAALAQAPALSGTWSQAARLDRLHDLAAAPSSSSVWALAGRRHFTRAGDVWAPEFWTTFHYQDLHRVREQTDAFNGTFWAPATTVNYTWEDGALRVEEYQQWDGAAWVPSERYLYTYFTSVPTPHPIAREMHLQQWDGAAWQDVELTTYVLAVEGEETFVTAGQTHAWDGTRWTPTEQFDAVQDGDYVVQTYRQWGGAAWTPSERFVYYGQTRPRLYKAIRDVLRLIEDVGTFSNLPLLLIPAGTTEVWDGEAWVPLARQVVSAWDVPSGRPTILEMQDWDGEEWTTGLRLQARYTTTGQPTSLGIQMPLGGWVTTFEELYTYNAQHLLHTATHRMDSGFGLADTGQIVFEWHLITDAPEDPTLPARFALDPAYPNPFNPMTRLVYHLPAAGPVTLRVHDVLGRAVATLIDDVRPAGRHEVTFEAGSLPSGLYLVRLDAGGHFQTRPVTLVR